MTRDAVLHAAAAFRGWAYGGLDYGRQRVDCSAFAALVVREAFGVPAEVSTADSWWAAMMILDARRPWSPCEAAAVDPGGWLRPARTGPERPEVGRWMLVQSWRTLTGSRVDGETTRSVAVGDRGHTLLWLSTVGDPWMGWALESQEGVGPCMSTGDGVIPLGQSIDEHGNPYGHRPLAWADRMKRYAAGTAWCVLPEVW